MQRAVVDAPTIQLPPVGSDDTLIPDEIFIPEAWAGSDAGGPEPRPRAPRGQDTPREFSRSLSLSDRIFVHGSRSIGIVMLLIFGSIGVFLAAQAVPTFRHYGLSFLTRAEWNPASDKVGIAAVLVGTVTVAVIAMSIAFPLAFCTAIYISELAPAKLQKTLISMVDLMAAVPSIVYGLWGFFLIQPKAIYVARFINQYFGWIPIFHVSTDPNAASWAETKYTASAFIAAIAVSMMVMPMACAVMREVFSQTPAGEKEAALALGATRWDMIRSVVIPFSRGGIIGGGMLALGRALGETIAVVLIISPQYKIKVHPLEVGTNTISSLIAGRFAEATSVQLSALLTAGFVLFIITLIVNTLASIIVSRGRSGASTL